MTSMASEPTAQNFDHLLDEALSERASTQAPRNLESSLLASIDSASISPAAITSAISPSAATAVSLRHPSGDSIPAPQREGIGSAEGPLYFADTTPDPRGFHASQNSAWKLREIRRVLPWAIAAALLLTLGNTLRHHRTSGKKQQARSVFQTTPIAQQANTALKAPQPLPKPHTAQPRSQHPAIAIAAAPPLPKRDVFPTPTTEAVNAFGGEATPRLTAEQAQATQQFIQQQAQPILIAAIKIQQLISDSQEHPQ